MKSGDLVTEIEHTEVPGIQKISKVCLSFISRFYIFFLQTMSLQTNITEITLTVDGCASVLCISK